MKQPQKPQQRVLGSDGAGMDLNSQKNILAKCEACVGVAKGKRQGDQTKVISLISARSNMF